MARGNKVLIAMNRRSKTDGDVPFPRHDGRDDTVSHDGGIIGGHSGQVHEMVHVTIIESGSDCTRGDVGDGNAKAMQFPPQAFAQSL
jgi:hypothetical protein